MESNSRHVCGSECESVHQHVISKLLLTIKAGRPTAEQRRGKEEEVIRHLAEPSRQETPRIILNKWFHLGIYEDDGMRTEIRDLTMKWHSSYHVDFLLKIGKDERVLVRSLMDDKTIPISDMELLMERWTINFERVNDDVIVPELPEIYKRVIVLIRSVYATMRLIPASKLVRSVEDRRPYTDSPIGLALKMRSGQVPHDHDSGWAVIPGTEHLEQTSRLELAPVLTAHGVLKISLEHRQQFEFSLERQELGESIGSLKESFEELGKIPVIPKRLSQVSSIGSSPSSQAVSSPRLKLGRGASSPRSPRRSMSQPNIASPLLTTPASTSSVTSPLPSPGGPRARTSSILAIGSGLVAKSPPASITGSSLYTPMSPSVLGDTAITQFMKQCENHPTLESLRTPIRDELILFRRTEKLRDQLSNELELWLSDFRAVESLSAPLPKPKSQDASVYSQAKLPTVSPVIECQSEDNSVESNASEDYHLMFPL